MPPEDNPADDVQITKEQCPETSGLYLPPALRQQVDLRAENESLRAANAKLVEVRDGLRKALAERQKYDHESCQRNDAKGERGIQ